MAKRKKIDMDKVANEMAKQGPVESIEWIGDQDKAADIFRRLGEGILEILQTNPKEDWERLKSERTAQAMKELEEAGIRSDTTPVFGTWPLQPGEES